MSNDDNRAADNGQSKGITRALLNSMWGFWIVLLVISFGLAGVIHFIWLRGNV